MPSTPQTLRFGEGTFRHVAPIDHLQSSADGKHLIAIGSQRMTTFLIATGEVVNSEAAPKKVLAVSPSGTSYADHDRKAISLYNTKDQKVLASLEKSAYSRTNSPERAVFSSDGKLFATAPRGRYISTPKNNWPINVWSTKTGEISYTLKGNKLAVCDVAFSPNNKHLCSIDRRGNVRLFAFADCKVVWLFESGFWARGDTDSGEEHQVCFSPDGRSIAVGLSGSNFLLFDAESGALQWRARRGFTDKGAPVTFSMDGSLLFAGDGARVRVFSSKDGKEAKPPVGCLGPISRIYETKTPGELLVRGANDPYLWQINSQTSKPFLLDGEVQSVARAPADGVSRTLVSGDGERIARLDFDVDGFVYSRSGECLCKVRIEDEAQLRDAAISYDGRLLALVETLGSANYPHNQNEPARLSLFSVDGACLIARLAEGKFLEKLKKPIFSPDSRYLACVGESQILVFDCQQKKLLLTLTEGLSGLRTARFSEDSAALYAIDASGLLLSWSIPSGALGLKAFLLKEFYEAELLDIRASRIAIMSDGGVGTFDAKTGSLIESFSGVPKVTTICFSKDGKGRLLGYQDGTVVWQNAPEIAPKTAPQTPKKEKENISAWVTSFERALSQSEAKALESIQKAPPSLAQDEGSLRKLRDLLMGLWSKKGVTPVHKALSERLLSSSKWRWHNDQRVPGHIEVVSMRHDGRYLAMGSNCGDGNLPGGTLQIYEMATGQCVQTIYDVRWGLGQGRGGGDRDRMAWSPNGKLIGSSYDQNGVAIFDAFAKRNQVRMGISVTDGSDSGPCWCFVSDKEIAIAVGMWEGYIFERKSFLPFTVYDISGEDPVPFRALDDGKRIKGFDKQDPVDWVQWMGTSPDGERLCVASRKPVMVIDPRSGDVLYQGKGSGGYHSLGALFSPDGRWYFDGYELCPTNREKPLKLGVSALEDSRWSPDSEILALAATDSVSLYSVKRKKMVAKFSCDVAKDPHDVLLGDSGIFAFSPDAKFLAVREEEHISVWDISAKDPREVARIKPKTKSCGLALGEGAQTLACWGREHLEFWHVGSFTGSAPVLAAEQNMSSKPIKGSSDIQQPRPMHYLAKPLNVVPLTDSYNQYYQDDSGHPLCCAGGFAGDAFAQDPSFPVPGLGWITAFESGLIVCPKELSPTLCERLTLCLNDYFSWPLSWALDSFTVVEDLAKAFTSPKFPAKIIGPVRDWFEGKSRPAPKPELGARLRATTDDGILSPTRSLGWYTTDEEHEIKSAKQAKKLLTSLHNRFVWIEQETDWSPDKAKAGSPYEFHGDYVMLRRFSIESGGGGSVNYSNVRRVKTLKYAGHPYDAVAPAEALPSLSLKDRRVALLNLTWEKDSITQTLKSVGATIVELDKSPEILIVRDPYDEKEQQKLLAEYGSLTWMPSSIIRSLSKTKE